MKWKFKVHVKKSEDKQFYFTLVGLNGEIVATSEMYTRKYKAEKLPKDWFKGVEIIDDSRKIPVKK